MVKKLLVIFIGFALILGALGAILDQHEDCKIHTDCALCIYSITALSDDTGMVQICPVAKIVYRQDFQPTSVLVLPIVSIYSHYPNAPPAA